MISRTGGDAREVSALLNAGRPRLLLLRLADEKGRPTDEPNDDHLETLSVSAVDGLLQGSRRGKGGSERPRAHQTAREQPGRQRADLEETQHVLKHVDTAGDDFQTLGNLEIRLERKVEGLEIGLREGEGRGKGRGRGRGKGAGEYVSERELVCRERESRKTNEGPKEFLESVFRVTVSSGSVSGQDRADGVQASQP